VTQHSADPATRDAAAPPLDSGPGNGTSRALVVLLAVACGAAVANLYYAQPLLDTISADLGASAGTTGLLLVTTQLGYAVGLVLLVPLGDLLDRRRLVTTVLAVTTVALAGAAVAPGISTLALALAAVGVTSVVAQVLVPFAATLAADDERGKVVGTVMSGLLLGILLARTLSGALAAVGGWRSVFAVAAVLMVLLAVVLRLRLPQVPPASDLRYGAALRSILTLFRTHPVLGRRVAYGAVGFAAFSVFWTSVAFLLAGPPFGYGEAAIGLLGLAGVAGALCAQVSGRVADRGWTRWGTGGWLALLTASFGVLYLGGTSLVLLVVGVVVLDAGVQGNQVLNQSVIYALDAEARSRLTTAYLTTTFIGGAAGSGLSAWLYGVAGWGGVCLAGALIGAAGLVLWLTELRRR
jgi:predicted MFS family arabinose efflux permease